MKTEGAQIGPEDPRSKLGKGGARRQGQRARDPLLRVKGYEVNKDSTHARVFLGNLTYTYFHFHLSTVNAMQDGI